MVQLNCVRHHTNFALLLLYAYFKINLFMLLLVIEVITLQNKNLQDILKLSIQSSLLFMLLTTLTYCWLLK